MGRTPSFPPLFNEIKSISLADLNRCGSLKPGCHSGVLSFTRGNTPTGKVNFTVYMWEGKGCFEISYTLSSGQHIEYQVPLVAVPSNLGIGQRWYFICPRTGKRCSKLHYANGYFQHRTGIPGAFYECQTRSHFWRAMYIALFRLDRPRRPYAKRHYRGKPVRRRVRRPGKYARTFPWLEKKLNAILSR